MSDSLKGRTHTPESNAKRSAAMKAYFEQIKDENYLNAEVVNA